MQSRLRPSSAFAVVCGMSFLCGLLALSGCGGKGGSNGNGSDAGAPDGTSSDGGANECVDHTLNCDDTLTGETTVGRTNDLDNYHCPQGEDLTGGEVVYSFHAAQSAWVEAEVPLPTPDPDNTPLALFVLINPCDATSCIAQGVYDGVGSIVVSFHAHAGNLYYIVVDGYGGWAGDFDITLSCGQAEECTNGTDDDGNSLIDCWDPQCNQAMACKETLCADGLDNDNDGHVDCDDMLDCWVIGQTDCYESDCADSVDNDRDGELDCVDSDCFGESVCAGIGSGQIGDPCTTNLDCESGACIKEKYLGDRIAGWPSGYCVIMSGEACVDLNCPAGSVCVPWDMFTRACLADCSTNPTVCRAGYQCEDFLGDGSVHVCMPNCDDNAQCPETGYCFTGTAQNMTAGRCYMPDEICTGGVDDDGDGLADCDDFDCLYTQDCTPRVSVAGGDDCSGVEMIPLPNGERGRVAVAGTTTGAADDLELSCVGPSGGADVVYGFMLTAPAFVRIYLRGGDGGGLHPDPAVALRADCQGSDLLCNDHWMSKSVSFALFYIWSWHTLIEAMVAPGLYYVVVESGSAMDSGDFVLVLSLSDAP